MKSAEYDGLRETGREEAAKVPERCREHDAGREESKVAERYRDHGAGRDAFVPRLGSHLARLVFAR